MFVRVISGVRAGGFRSLPSNPFTASFWSNPVQGGRSSAATRARHGGTAAEVMKVKASESRSYQVTTIHHLPVLKSLVKLAQQPFLETVAGNSLGFRLPESPKSSACWKARSELSRTCAVCSEPTPSKMGGFGT